MGVTRFRPRPLQALLLAGLVIILAGSLVTAWAAGRVVEGRLVARDAERVAGHIRMQFGEHVERDAFALTAKGVAGMARDLLQVPDLFRVKVFDPGGRIVWSNESRLIGRVFPGNAALARALAGQTVVGVVKPGGTEHQYERSVRRVREIYVPIGPAGGAPVGVVEVYLDAAPFEAEVSRVRLTLAATSAGVALVLYALLSAAVWRASVALRHARDREREEVEARLRLVERLRAFGEIAAGATHDLGNVFMVLSGRLDLLGRMPGLPAKASASLDPMQKAVADGVEITRRISNIRRSDDRQAFERVSLAGVVTDVIRMTEPRWRRCEKVEIVPALDAVPPVFGRPSELREVLTNLVLNALDAMPSGGLLTIATSAVNGHVKLEVTDTGTGIPRDLRRQLFVPFTTTKPNGTGLGLSVSYGIVKRHGGTITVESEESRGSRFVVSLPVAPPSDPEAAPR